MTEVNDVGDDVARQIESSAQDSLKNHGFDWARNWIHQHAAFLSSLADVLTWIATGIVIAALVLGTGGAALAAIPTAGALLAHSLLAANGDGSWVDVGLDVFALATFGAGKLLTTGAKMLLGAREGIEVFQETITDARLAFAKANGLSKIGVWLRQSNPVIRTIKGFAAGREEYAAVVGKTYEGSRGLAGFRERIIYGDTEAAGISNAIEDARTRLGDGVLLRGAAQLMRWSVPVWKTGFGTDAIFHYLNPTGINLGSAHVHCGGVQPWVRWKEANTVHAISAP